MNYFSHILILFSFVCIPILGQEKSTNSRFEFQQTHEKSIAGIKSVMNEEVVITTRYKALENYNKIHQLLSKKYEYPEDVIIEKIPSKKIVVREVASDLFTMISSGYRSSFDMRYLLTFEIRDQYVLLRVSNMQNGNSVSASGNFKWRNTDGLYLHKRNGKPKKSMKGITDVRIENHFNAIVTSLKEM
ncbi:MAG: hypothetical protein ACPH2K_01100 [Flavicella sp.]